MSHTDPQKPADPRNPGGHPDEEEIELNPTQARQGRFGRPVFTVLVVSTVLALVLVGAVTLFFTLSSEVDEGGTVVTTEPDDSPPTPVLE